MRPKFRARFATLVVLPGSALLAACDSEEHPNAPRPEPSAVVAVVAGRRDDPECAVLEAARRQWIQRDRRLRIDLRACGGESPAEQRSLLAGLPRSKVHAVCLWPLEPRYLRDLVDRLERDGTPVITVGRDVPGADRTVYCGPSDFEIGRAAARACREAVEGRSPTVMLLHAGPFDEATQSRYNGFTHELPAIGGLRLLREVDCQADRAEALRLVRVETRKYPRTGCWVFLDDWPLRNLGKDDRLLEELVPIVLCDGSPRHLHRLRRGELAAMIAFDVRRAVEEAIFAAVRLARAENSGVLSSYTVPCEIITLRELVGYERRWRDWQNAEP